MTADPATVEVVGPESAVKRATEALTEPVSVGGAATDVTETVTVGLLDPALRLKSARPATVTVQIRARSARAHGARPPGPSAQPRRQPDGAGVPDRRRRDRARQPRRRWRASSADDVVPFVDLAGLGAGEYTLAVHVDAVADAGVARVEPADGAGADFRVERT